MFAKVDYMSTGELAQLLGVSPATITYQARQGHLPGAEKPLGRWRFRRQEIEAWTRSFQASGQRSLPLSWQK